MRHQRAYSTHLPVLIHLIQQTVGDVLELGIGTCSTPVIHWLCTPKGRSVVSYETDSKWHGWAQEFQNPLHSIHLVTDWDQVALERPWSVALIDQAPPERRRVDALRLADWADYIILHDSDGRLNRIYHYELIIPQFKYVFSDTRQRPHTTVVSNKFDVGGLVL